MKFIFEAPVEYPGLRIKYTPKVINGLLIASFALLTLGLYITFFCQPVLVKMDEAGCTVGGPKPEGMLLKVQQWMEESAETDFQKDREENAEGDKK